jgi:hypothetical protein
MAMTFMLTKARKFSFNSAIGMDFGEMLFAIFLKQKTLNQNNNNNK